MKELAQRDLAGFRQSWSAVLLGQGNVCSGGASDATSHLPNENRCILNKRPKRL